MNSPAQHNENRKLGEFNTSRAYSRQEEQRKRISSNNAIYCFPLLSDCWKISSEMKRLQALETWFYRRVLRIHGLNIDKVLEKIKKKLTVVSHDCEHPKGI